MWIIYRFEIINYQLDIYAGRLKQEVCCPVCHMLNHGSYNRPYKWRPKLLTWIDHKPVHHWVHPLWVKKQLRDVYKPLHDKKLRTF